MKHGLNPLLLVLFVGCVPMMAPRLELPLGSGTDLSDIHGRPEMHTCRNPLPISVPRQMGNSVFVEPVKTSTTLATLYGWGEWFSVWPWSRAQPGIPGPEWTWWIGYQLPPLWPRTPLLR